MPAVRVAAVVALFCFSAVAEAQQTSRARISIQVNDPTGAYIPSAGIKAESLIPGQLETSIKADQQGQARLELPAGPYHLTATYYGFKTSSIDVDLKDGQSTNLEVILQPGTPCNPCGVIQVVDEVIPIEHQLPDASITPQALESPLTIRTAHNSAPELATKTQLEHLLAAHDLRQWTFTQDVIIDDKSIPHSHPVLTQHTRHLTQDDELLSTYLHEQLHWFFTRHPAETGAAEQDLMKLYPDVPIGYPEGANDRESTYLHLLVCRLEQQADRAVLGDQRTADVMQFWAGDHYRWVYRTVLADGPKIDEILRRHGVADPDARTAEPDK